MRARLLACHSAWESRSPALSALACGPRPPPGGKVRAPTALSPGLVSGGPGQRSGSQGFQIQLVRPLLSSCELVSGPARSHLWVGAPLDAELLVAESLSHHLPESLAGGPQLCCSTVPKLLKHDAAPWAGGTGKRGWPWPLPLCPKLAPFPPCFSVPNPCIAQLRVDFLPLRTGKIKPPRQPKGICQVQPKRHPVLDPNFSLDQGPWMSSPSSFQGHFPGGVL